LPIVRVLIRSGIIGAASEERVWYDICTLGVWEIDVPAGTEGDGDGCDNSSGGRHGGHSAGATRMHRDRDTETNWEICGEAENGKIAVEMVQKLHPAVVLLDLSMPVMNGLEAARQIAEIAPGTHVLMFTLHAYPHLIGEARRVGVKGVISKSDQGGPKS
jgi:CheY-like chemotaxis protein